MNEQIKAIIEQDMSESGLGLLAERKEYARFFEERKRNNSDETFVCCKEYAPQDLKELVSKIHREFFDCLPNDWIYGVIWEAFDELSRDSIDDITIEADIYHSQLYKWFGEPFAAELCNEAVEEGLSNGVNIYNTISTAEWIAKDRIYHVVNDFIQEE